MYRVSKQPQAIGRRICCAFPFDVGLHPACLADEVRILPSGIQEFGRRVQTVPPTIAHDACIVRLLSLLT